MYMSEISRSSSVKVTGQGWYDTSTHVRGWSLSKTTSNSTSVIVVLHGSGSGKIPRENRGSTAGVPREREERPPFVPRECRERDWLLRESRGTWSKRHFPPAGPGVTPGSLVGLLLLLFVLCLPLSLCLSCFRFSVHFRQFSEWICFLMCVRFYAAWYELRT